MMGSVRKFLSDRTGAFAIQFALMVVPLTLCTGLAIDGGRVFLARYELAQALDAAALAVGSTTGMNQQQLETLAQTYVDANFKGSHHGDIDVTLGDNANGNVVSLSGTVTIDTYFMPLVGRDTVTIDAESEVRKGGSNVEVALALDVTKSMDLGSPTRISSLKSAAVSLVNTVVQPNQTAQSAYYSRVAVVPWGGNVHVGSLAPSMRGTIAAAAVTAATWRNGTELTNTTATWRNGSQLSSVTATWRNGTSYTTSTTIKIDNITRTGSGTSRRVQIRFVGDPTNFANDDIVAFSLSSSTAGSWLSTLNNKQFKLSDRTALTGSNAGKYTFLLKVYNQTSTYFQDSISGTPTAASAASVSECFNLNCEVKLTNTGTNNLAANDYIYIGGFSSPWNAINNTGATPSRVSSTTAPTSTTAFINGSFGPTISFTADGSAGTVQECFNSACEVRITNTGTNGYAAGDYIYVSNLSTPYTAFNTSTPWQVSNLTAPTSTTFFLSGSVGPNVTSTSNGTGGRAQKCFTNTCEVKITAPGHGLTANGELIQMASMPTGWTGLNSSGTATSAIESLSGDDFIISGSTGPSYTTAYSGTAGRVHCLHTGCERYRFTNKLGNTTIRTITNCVSERVMGTNDATDAAPSAGNYLGLVYSGTSLGECQTANSVMTLSSDRTALAAHINAMTTTGSTAGQVGTAWGWYMLSPSWSSMFPGAAHTPAAYGAANTVKVMVLMTDGDFNTAFCNGVISSNYGYDDDVGSYDPNVDRIQGCNATNGDPFVQSRAICDEIHDADIRVYTIGFLLTPGGDGEDFLEYCASEPGFAHLAANATELQAAFDEIATDIARLRITR